MNKFVNLVKKKSVGMALSSLGALMLVTPPPAFATSMPQSGEEITAQIKQENGVNLYSTDGGNSWNKSTPTSTDQAVKIVNIKDGIAQIEAIDEADLKKAYSSMQIMIKQENGVNLYSIDGGKNWNEYTPTSTDQAVKIVSMKDGIAQIEAVNEADLKKADSSIQIMIKQENGVALYSTDKGKTWSEKAPNKN
ncbi:WD40/YVTN/BNR-like repeat-containing protein [Lysinibacillus fusiformis]|uniref:WD40/YVTN/BNR-like repeat-containing protein n=1 Tax=Lysinibacillus fusiformis TaxID=28031 RepID=UPI000D38A39B|nr:MULTISPECIES: hypothetical protein [Lysinibacillus]MED4669732.1 hypothetical protein [Lysinibacillus fusiformis]QAS55767.1 hypothetical protein LSP_04925 [Lysinibacillus sphaericus]RDV24950.1 hypothetical protein C7B90_23245 [Lysinibacillus fusiformis]GED66107.1 hypothetical protein LFU01_45590 [Lysinibacillus fusiformis]